LNYTREERDWIEAEWAFHLHGRMAFLSREDYAQLLAWEAESIPPEIIVASMEAFFQRRAQRARTRSFVALSHLEKDVAKVLKTHKSMAKAGPAAALPDGWEQVKEPLHGDPRARAAYAEWKILAIRSISPDSPSFLEHHDAERKAFRSLISMAEAALGTRSTVLQAELRQRMLESKLPEGTAVWRLAWEHHWSRVVCGEWGIAL
jgi:uncharacterized protein (DUF2267 family)